MAASLKDIYCQGDDLTLVFSGRPRDLDAVSNALKGDSNFSVKQVPMASTMDLHVKIDNYPHKFPHVPFNPDDSRIDAAVSVLETLECEKINIILPVESKGTVETLKSGGFVPVVKVSVKNSSTMSEADIYSILSSASNKIESLTNPELITAWEDDVNGKPTLQVVHSDAMITSTPHLARQEMNKMMTRLDGGCGISPAMVLTP